MGQATDDGSPGREFHTTLCRKRIEVCWGNDDEWCIRSKP